MAPSARPASVLAIVGEDSYLAEAALERVLAAAVPGERHESVSVLHGDEARWEDVLAAARAGSLFAASRAVVVRRAELLKYATPPKDGKDDEAGDSGGRGGKGRADEDPVEAYLAAPASDATLVLLCARPDKRRKPWKSLLGKGSPVEVHEAVPKRGRALRSYVEDELRRRGLRLSRDVLDLLIDEVGQDLRRLMGEVDKLEAWTEGRAEITVEDVAALVGQGLGQPLYLLSDAFAARDTTKALELLERLLEEGDQGPLVVAALHRTLRQVRGALALRQAGVPAGQIGARLLPGNMQFKLESLLTASRRWSERDVTRAIAVLEQTDRGIKRGANAAVALTSAVVTTSGARSPASGGSTSPRRAT
jgi:DNA polymerase III delta subunit